MRFKMDLQLFGGSGNSSASSRKGGGGKPISEDVGDYLKNKYTVGRYSDCCNYAEYLMYGTINGKSPDDNSWAKSMVDSISNEDKEMSQKLLDTINGNETNEKLYRIDRIHNPNDLQVGDELNWGIVSTSSDKNFMKKVLNDADEGVDFSELDKNNLVQFVFDGKKKGLNISKYSPYDQSEVLTSGKFKITSITKVPAKQFKAPKTKSGEELLKNTKRFKQYTSKKGTEMVLDKKNNKIYEKRKFITKSYYKGEAITSDTISYMKRDFDSKQYSQTIVHVKQVR